MKTTLALTAVGALALGLAAVPAVAATGQNNVIKVNKSINRIQVGNSEKRVVKKLGAPKSVENGTNDFGKYSVLHYRNKFQVTVNLERGVTLMTTKSKQTRTAADIGVGSSKKDLRDVYKVTCEKVVSQPGWQTCITREAKPGVTTTAFRLKNMIIKQVDVGTVLD